MNVEVVINGAIGGPQQGKHLATFTREELVTCSYATHLLGGCGGANVTIRPEIVLARDQPWFADVQMAVDGALVYQGRHTEPDEADGWQTGFPADGYYFTGMEDMTFLTSVASTVTSTELAAAVLDQSCPVIIPSTGDTWVPSQGSYIPATYNGMLPSAIFAELAKAAHSSGYPMTYQVWPGGRLWSVPLIPPAVPDYVIAQHEPGLKRKRSAKASYASVAVEYTGTASGIATVPNGFVSVTVTHGMSATPALEEFTVTPSDWGNATKVVISNRTPDTFDIVVDANPGAGGATFGWRIQREHILTPAITDPTFVDRLRIPFRRLRIPNAGVMSRTAALAFRDAEAKRRAYPTVSTTIARQGTPLRGPAGDEVPLAQVRAGEWLWVEGDVDQSGRPVIAPLLSTSYDVLSERFTAQVGAAMPGLLTSIRETRHEEGARRLRVRPLSGARER